MLPANLLAATLNKLALTERPLIPAAQDKNSAQSALDKPPLADKQLITATQDKNAAAQSTLKLQVGQQVQGSVQTQVSANVFQVRIGDQIMQMQLPATVRSGSLVTLQVVSLQPKLTFALSASANPISTSEQLSSASRLLSSMSQQPVEQPYVKPLQPAPLWVSNQTAAPDTTALAEKLHNTLSHSGLFYESHQAQWIAGMRSTPQLLMEPQNQLPHNPHQSSSAVSGEIPEHLQMLVQQQLHALENRQVLWQGQAWQGQEMRWEVREESPRHRANGGHESGQWVTELHLDLPHLGTLSAKLSFNGSAVDLTLNVSDESTRSAMTGASSQLVAALNERGIQVSQTRIGRAEGKAA